MSIEQATHVLRLFLRDAVANDTAGSKARVQLRAIRLIDEDAHAPAALRSEYLRVCMDTVGESVIEHVQYLELSPDHDVLVPELARILGVPVIEAEAAYFTSLTGAIGALEAEDRGKVRSQLTTAMDLGGGRKLVYLDCVLGKAATTEALDALSVALMSDAEECAVTATLRLALLTARMASMTVTTADASANPAPRRRRMGI